MKIKSLSVQPEPAGFFVERRGIWVEKFDKSRRFVKLGKYLVKVKFAGLPDATRRVVLIRG